MGKKSKGKTKAKKKAKAALKKKGIKNPSLKAASKLAQQSEKTGIDPTELLSSAVGGIPFVGGLASNLIDQTSAIAGAQGVSGRGGVRGVQLVDSKLGNLGTISRKKALQVLMTRGKKAPRPRKPTFIQVPQGQSVVRV
ncbi:MAG: hypothetical protein ACREBO_14075 [Novosphingobium sp.]